MSNNITFIDEKIMNNEEKYNIEKNNINDNNIINIILDFELPLDTRIYALEYIKEEHKLVEIINKITGMFMFSNTKILEEFIYEICMNSNIDTTLKIDCATSLCYYCSNSTIGYTALNHICKKLDNIPTPLKIESVILLMSENQFKVNSKNYFCNIINDITIDCDFRYKTILSLENKIKNKDDLEYFLKESMLSFLNNQNNMTMYRILSSQVLFIKCNLSDENIEYIENIILSFALDEELDYDIRADAADVLLRYSKKLKNRAREIIMCLGRQLGNVKTIFDNAQNVHTEEIEESVLEGLAFLFTIKTIVISNKKITFNIIKKQIEDLVNQKYGEDSKHTDKEKIEISLNRIYMDRALYSKYNCSLLNIFIKVWSYISGHDHEKEMKKRALEELVDMSGTCSSGFASRLINIISGFGDFNIKISWKDQIVSNFIGRLNSRARDIVNYNISIETAKEIYYKIHSSSENIVEEDINNIKEEYQERVLYEMTLEDYQDKPLFLKFFRDNVLKIREEMYEEFSQHMSDTDFDLWFRQAIAVYEGVDINIS